jgi:hypothetical protein
MSEKQTLTTKAELARQAGIDQRNPVLDELEPVAEIKLRGPKPVKVYDKAQAINELAALLLASAAKHSKD